MTEVFILPYGGLTKSKGHYRKKTAESLVLNGLSPSRRNLVREIVRKHYLPAGGVFVKHKKLGLGFARSAKTVARSLNGAADLGYLIKAIRMRPKEWGGGQSTNAYYVPLTEKQRTTLGLLVCLLSLFMKDQERVDTLSTWVSTRVSRQIKEDLSRGLPMHSRSAARAASRLREGTGSVAASGGSLPKAPLSVEVTERKVPQEPDIAGEVHHALVEAGVDPATLTKRQLAQAAVYHAEVLARTRPRRVFDRWVAKGCPVSEEGGS